ncbi:helix-turn-helix domain-containing protein, partial [Aurantimonas sp. DM33-3]|uniref:helix-turn-helix domain-containing protein n=1 Tax=Aurantimonas sp. DM33-3 TaxID=2766955 RepID=UPI001AEE23E7
SRQVLVDSYGHRSFPPFARQGITNAQDRKITAESDQAQAGMRLTAQEHAALDKLIRAGDRVTPKRMLGEHLYALHQDWSDNAVETLVHRLRRKLSEAGATVELKALRGLGYILCETRS